MGERRELPLTIFDTTSIRGLIDGLKIAELDASVCFDFGHAQPSGRVHSWRGMYEHLAVDWEPERAKNCTVGLLVESLRQAEEEVFEGYKGGNYRMHPSTPVWVDQKSHASSTGIVGVNVEGDWHVTILTKKSEAV